MRRKSSSQCCYTQVCYNCSISWLVVQVHRLKLVVRTQLLALWAMKLCNRTVCPHVFLCVCFRQSAYHLMTSFILFVSLLTRLKTHLVTAKPCRYITRRICPVPWVIRLGRPPCTIFLNGSPLRGVVQKMNSQFHVIILPIESASQEDASLSIHLRRCPRLNAPCVYGSRTWRREECVDVVKALNVEYVLLFSVFIPFKKLTLE